MTKLTLDLKNLSQEQQSLITDAISAMIPAYNDPARIEKMQNGEAISGWNVAVTNRAGGHDFDTVNIKGTTLEYSGFIELLQSTLIEQGLDVSKASGLIAKIQPLQENGITYDGQGNNSHNVALNVTHYGFEQHQVHPVLAQHAIEKAGYEFPSELLHARVWNPDEIRNQFQHNVEQGVAANGAQLPSWMLKAHVGLPEPIIAQQGADIEQPGFLQRTWQHAQQGFQFLTNDLPRQFMDAINPAQPELAAQRG